MTSSQQDHININTTSPFGYHPAYGLPNTYRLSALEYATVHGVARAAEKYRVSQTTIYNWISAAERSGC